jgi:mannosyltransferase
MGHRLLVRPLMSTYATRRPAWTLKARALGAGWVAVPIGLGVLVALSLLLRTDQLGIGFWIDEGLSVGIADRPLSDIPLALREDGSPPLYYMLLHFWLDVAGRGESGVRGLSLLFALLAVPVAWWAGRAIWGTPRGAWTAATLAAFNPFLSQYAQEARMYSLVSLLIIPATTCFVKAYALDTERRRPWIAGFAVSVGAALYTHNWPIFFTVGAAVAWVLLWVLAEGPRRRELFRDALLGFGGLLVLYLPWIPTTLYQAAHTGAPWADAPALDSLLGVPGVLLGTMPQIVLLICAGTGLVALGRTRPLGQHGRAAACLAIIAVLTPTIAWTLSQSSPAWANRYFAAALPPFLLLAAGGLANARRLGLVGLALVTIMWVQDGAPVEKSNVRAVAHNITPGLKPGDLVISTQPETVPVLHYYLPDGLRYATLTGGLTELGVWDWRDGVERLERTNPEEDLGPLVDALPAGARVVLVEPITWTLNRWRAPWTKLVRIRSKEWAQYLSNDPRLRVAAVQPTSFTPPRPNPVRATVLVKTG